MDWTGTGDNNNSVIPPIFTHNPSRIAHLVVNSFFIFNVFLASYIKPNKSVVRE